MNSPKFSEGVETEVHGTVREMLPQSLYSVELDDHQIVKASISVKAKRVVVAIKPGDRVLVRIHAHDPTRAAIEARLSK